MVEHWTERPLFVWLNDAATGLFALFDVVVLLVIFWLVLTP